MPYIHLGGRGGWTRCSLWIPELLDGERHWIPLPSEALPGPVTCPDCIAGRAARRSSTLAKELHLWTVYDHPRDYPTHWVVRESVVAGGKLTMAPSPWLAVTLDEARALVPPGLHCMPRQPTDDPVIVEVWL